jgi:hypothetical protein
MPLDTMLREERLELWDDLVRGRPVSKERLRSVLLPVSREVSGNEKLCCALLWAAARISREASPAMRRNLTALLRYWFSQEGVPGQPAGFDRCSLAGAGLGEVMGLGLSWPEAMESVGGNPKDYTALVRVTALLRKECLVAWKEMFGESVPRVLAEGGDDHEEP